MVNNRGHVLVTRPEPGASRTAAALEARGFAPVVVPLTETRALAPERPTGDYRLVVATSANAVRHADALMLDVLRDLPALVVGERTAEMFRNAGFANVEAADGSALLLAELAIARSDGADRIAYLCGRPRRPELQARLGETGRHVAVIETYETLRRIPAQAEIGQLMARPVDAVLVYSPESARALGAVTSVLDLARTSFFCLSAAVAQSLPPGCVGHVAERADEAALLDLLDRHF